MAGFRPAPRLLTAVVVGAFATTGAVLVAAQRSEGATGKAIVRLTDRQMSLVHFGNAAGVGGGEVARLRLYGSRGAAQVIGHAVITCLNVGGGERTCQGSYVLPRGTLETMGVVRTRLLYTQAVVGGTGLFDDARGTLTVTAKSLSPRREILLFRLTG